MGNDAIYCSILAGNAGMLRQQCSVLLIFYPYETTILSYRRRRRALSLSLCSRTIQTLHGFLIKSGGELKLSQMMYGRTHYPANNYEVRHVVAASWVDRCRKFRFATDTDETTFCLYFICTLN